MTYLAKRPRGSIEIVSSRNSFLLEAMSNYDVFEEILVILREDWDELKNGIGTDKPRVIEEKIARR